MSLEIHSKSQALEALDHSEMRLRFLIGEIDDLHVETLRERLEQTLEQIGGVKRFVHNIDEEV